MKCILASTSLFEWGGLRAVRLGCSTFIWYLALFFVRFLRFNHDSEIQNLGGSNTI